MTKHTIPTENQPAVFWYIYFFNLAVLILTISSPLKGEKFPSLFIFFFQPVIVVLMDRTVQVSAAIALEVRHVLPPRVTVTRDAPLDGNHPSVHKVRMTALQGWYNVGLASYTVGQHCSNNGGMFRVFRVQLDFFNQPFDPRSQLYLIFLFFY